MNRLSDIRELESDRILDASEIADLLGIDVKTARELATSGKIKAFKVGTMYRYLASDLIEYINSNPAVKEVE
jgi:excisionase family DNA binding protein